jgi:glycosyltransferase involved in cell wall biosynthesis
VPEVLEQGVSGYLVESEDAAVDAIAACHAHDRTLCRRAFMHRFTASRMASDYVKVYRRIAKGRGASVVSRLEEAKPVPLS